MLQCSGKNSCVTFVYLQALGWRMHIMLCTDPGKVWKVMEFKIEVFQALKSLENDQRYGKVWKNP